MREGQMADRRGLPAMAGAEPVTVRIEEDLSYWPSEGWVQVTGPHMDYGEEYENAQQVLARIVMAAPLTGRLFPEASLRRRGLWWAYCYMRHLASYYERAEYFHYTSRTRATLAADEAEGVMSQHRDTESTEGGG